MRIYDYETCIKCDSKSHYSETYDSYYCKKCDEWLDDTCDDKECEFCSQRPKKPSDKKVK